MQNHSPGNHPRTGPPTQSLLAPLRGKARIYRTLQGLFILVIWSLLSFLLWLWAMQDPLMPY